MSFERICRISAQRFINEVEILNEPIGIGHAKAIISAWLVDRYMVLITAEKFRIKFLW